MAEPIATGHWVRPRPGIHMWQVLLGTTAIYALAGALAAFVNDWLFAPVTIGTSLTLLGFFSSRMERHHRRVAAAIKATHDIEVPEQAIKNLLYDRETMFTHGGRRYRVEQSHVPGPDNQWQPTTIVLVDMGADAATLFGPG